MRITQTMINRSMMQSLGDSKQALNKVQNEISTGIRVGTSSDDPVSFSRAVNYKNTINQNEEYISNIIDSGAWMETSYSILNEFYDLTVDAKDISLQGADDVMGISERNSLADKVDSIYESLDSLANSTYQNKYIFAGTATTGEKPINTDGDTIEYMGNSEAITRRISENYDITINIAGDEILDTGVFTYLDNLRTALRENDTETIRQANTDLNKASDSLLSIISRTNSIKNQADMTQNRLETANINLNSYLSQTQDADLVEAISNYNIEEMAYKAALQTTSDAINLNLLDYLR